ncbi:MAG TPA: laccase domain-containing protein, partial [Candidatus Acidoferrales bacterium]|nr:laccase domain-containing protein [Candidatus Acidoferrales bacterium]
MRRAVQTRKRVAQARTRARRASAPRGWAFHKKAGVEILQASAFAREAWLVHGFSTRLGGVSRLAKESVLNLGFTEWDTKEVVGKNRAALLASIGASRMQLVSLRQIHSDAIHRVDEVPHEPLKGDALISATPGLVLGVQTADCVPILLADTRT